MSSHFLAGYHFCLVRDNRDQDQVNYEIAAIKVSNVTLEVAADSSVRAVKSRSILSTPPMSS